MYVTVVYIDLLVGLLAVEAGVVSDSFSAFGTILLILGRLL